MEIPIRDVQIRPEPVLEDGPPIYHRAKLTGWLERQGFHPVLTAFLLFIVSFILFQGIASVIAIAIVLSDGGIGDVATILAQLEERIDALLIGNTVGQIFGMAVLVWLWTRLHTRETSAFLRVSRPDLAVVGFALFGLFGLLPVIQWLGELNQMLPLPDFLVQLEKSQTELIEQILSGGISIPTAVLALAITPALCEELLFRGYLQRQFERGFGPAGGIIVTGVVFGLYHFRLSQALPLAVLGIFLGYLVWKTGSLWVPIIIHFFNNAFAIVATNIATNNPELGLQDIEHIAVPWPVVITGAVIFAGSLYAINQRVSTIEGKRSVHSNVGADPGAPTHPNEVSS